MVELKNNELLNINGGCLALTRVLYFLRSKIRKLFRGFYII